MNLNLVNFADLQELSGYDTPGRVAHWCERHRVPVFVGKDGMLATTLDALNLALGVAKNEGVAHSIEFDD